MDIVGDKANYALRLGVKRRPAGITKTLAVNDEQGQQNAQTAEPSNGS